MHSPQITSTSTYPFFLCVVRIILLYIPQSRFVSISMCFLKNSSGSVLWRWCMCLENKCEMGSSPSRSRKSSSTPLSQETQQQRWGRIQGGTQFQMSPDDAYALYDACTRSGQTKTVEQILKRYPRLDVNGLNFDDLVRVLLLPFYHMHTIKAVGQNHGIHGLYTLWKSFAERPGWTIRPDMPTKRTNAIAFRGCQWLGSYY